MPIVAATSDQPRIWGSRRPAAAKPEPTDGCGPAKLCKTHPISAALQKMTTNAHTKYQASTAGQPKAFIAAHPARTVTPLIAMPETTGNTSRLGWLFSTAKLAVAMSQPRLNKLTTCYSRRVPPRVCRMLQPLAYFGSGSGNPGPMGFKGSRRRDKPRISDCGGLASTTILNSLDLGRARSPDLL